MYYQRKNNNQDQGTWRRLWYSLGLPKKIWIFVWPVFFAVAALALYDLSRWPSAISLERAGGGISMRLISSLCMIFALMALISHKYSFNRFLSRYLPLVFQFIISIISLFSLFAIATDIITGKESVITEIPAFNSFLDPSTRMSLFTALSFLSVSIIIILLWSNHAGLAHLLTIPLALVSYFFILSHVLGVEAFINNMVPASLDVSLGMAGLCALIFLIHPETWLTRVFTSRKPGSIIARELILPLFFIPIVIGWLRINGERQGYFSSEVGVLYVAIAYTLCFCILAWIAARSMNLIDKKREKSEEAYVKSHARLELLSGIASKLLISENPQKVVNELCENVLKFLKCDVFFNYLVDPNSGKLHLNAYSGVSADAAKEIEWLEFGTAICGCVAREGERMVAECVQQSNDIQSDLIRNFGIRVYACHPLMSHDRVIGTLSFGARNRDHFNDEDLALMKTITDQVAIAMGRIQNDKDLRESEDRFRTISESLPVLISITRREDSTVQFANEAYQRAFGYSLSELIGKKAIDIYVDPADRNRLMDTLQQKGFASNFEARVLRSDGTPFWIMASVCPIMFSGESCFLSAIIDVDESKRAQEKLIKLNHTLNALGKSSHIMMHSNNEMQYLRELCKIIIEDCGYLMVWIGYARNDAEKTVEPVAYHGFDRGYIEKMKITWSDTERGSGPTGTSIRTGKPVICANMQTDPTFKPWREDAIKRGYGSSIVLPLISEGKAFGTLCIYSREPEAFLSEDVRLLSNLANDLAYGITNIRLMESERNAARAIKESEEKYRLLLDEMIEGFALNEIILDERGNPIDYRFLNVNPAFEKQTGLRAEQVIGKTAREIMPLTEALWIKNYGKVALTGVSTDFESYSADLKAYFRVSVVSPKKGLFAVIFENITNRITAAKELQSTKNYLENLINYANAPIIVWNTDTEIQLFNHAFEHLTGYTSEEVIGHKLDMLFPESTLEDSYEKIRIAHSSHWETTEIPILTKDKKIKTVLWNSANIYDTDNTTLLSTIAQGHDITERILAEQEVRLSKEKLDLALDNANIGIWTWDVKNDRFEWDDRIGKMFGTNHVEDVHHYEDFERHIYEEDINHFNKAIHKALEEDIPLDTIFRTRLKNGGFRYIDAKSRVEKDVQGKPVRMTGVLLDITAMKIATEKTLFNLNEDLLRSNKELEQFAYVASHDLQEPLRMVSSFTQLLSLRYKDKLDTEALEFIGFAVDGAQRMQRLINDLLQYSRIKTRGKTLHYINMNDVLTQTLHNLSIKIKEKKARITSENLPMVYADEGQMIQLFQNLIENGIKFSKKLPRIHICVEEEDDFFTFSISDNGIGIEPQYFERIFQIFQRLHLKEEYGGTGIGLAICKRIIERHGGKIWVDSEHGKGTTFKFTLKNN